ncbi:WYL domain-containing protein [Candidatus Woesearchaeota archaeon]|nr:WYL domain-containing protein [Candidatus Woesearchaeota archaeon]
MSKAFSNQELKKIYQVLKSFNEGLIINPNEELELDYHNKVLIDKKGLAPILNKIKKLLPEEESKEANKIVLRHKYDIFNSEVDENAYRIIEKAFNNKKTVEIEYFDIDSAETKKREIEVYHKTRRYVIAYCYLRKAMRKFRTSRIISAKITNKSYVIPNDFDKNKY